MPDTIRNPVEWGLAQLTRLSHGLAAGYQSLHHIQETIHSPKPAVRRITIADIRDALTKGWEDFGAYRTDVISLCVVYPILGLAFGWLVAGNNLVPLMFPLASGFALVGPLAAVGLYELSRRREQGHSATWTDAFSVIQSPAFGAIAILGLLLTGIFLLWLAAAWAIYTATLGPEPPATIFAFARDVFTTEAGWMMILAGVGVGFVFAVLAMSISVVSFPLLLDRDAGVDTAISTSIRAVAANPIPMAFWGLIVAVALVAGMLPFFIGLVVVFPVLGHATWHLYRKLVA